MIELSFQELDDFCEAWRGKKGFRDVVRGVTDWAERNEVEIDFVQDENESWGVQIALYDAAGPFFAEPVLIRNGMDIERRLSESCVKARKRRIATITRREASALAA